MINLGRPANDDMVQGYRDGFDLNSPKPSSNRSYSYRHGFKNGRADKTGTRWNSFQELVRLGDEVMMIDDLISNGVIKRQYRSEQ
jgi:hypothetical protein